MKVPLHSTGVASRLTVCCSSVTYCRYFPSSRLVLPSAASITTGLGATRDFYRGLLADLDAGDHGEADPEDGQGAQEAADDDARPDGRARAALPRDAPTAAQRPEVGRRVRPGRALRPDLESLVLVTRALSASEARRLALAAQGFDRPRPRGRVDVRHLRRVIHQLGLLHIDYVNVL